MEFELGLQESMELIAKSAITRKLGDESSSLQAVSSIEPTNPVIAETRVNNQESNLIRQMREKLEWSRGDGYDTLYTFALPVSMPQILAWTRLLAKVQRGELIP